MTRHAARSLLTFLKIALLAPAYVIVVALAAISKRPLLAITLAATGVLVAAWQLSSCAPQVRVGTFNIQQLGVRVTDTSWCHVGGRRRPGGLRHNPRAGGIDHGAFVAEVPTSPRPRRGAPPEADLRELVSSTHLHPRGRGRVMAMLVT